MRRRIRLTIKKLIQIHSHLNDFWVLTCYLLLSYGGLDWFVNYEWAWISSTAQPKDLGPMPPRLPTSNTNNNTCTWWKHIIIGRSWVSVALLDRHLVCSFLSFPRALSLGLLLWVWATVFSSPIYPSLSSFLVQKLCFFFICFAEFLSCILHFFCFYTIINQLSLISSIKSQLLLVFSFFFYLR